ncbi:MAG: methyltransferase domain-containing protein [Cryobacterium sp.]|nr:methyltransferase domain-containing protein [Cryobacterium sp.]
MEPLFLPLYERLAVALDVRPGTNVLDVGCGAGLALRHYAQRGADVVGVDAAAGLLSIAKSRVPSAELHHASLIDMPLGDSSFDSVTGVNSFVYADDGGLGEAHRVLRPSGRLALGFWTDPMDFGWAMAALGEALAPHVDEAVTHTPLRMSEPGAAAGLLADAGFRILDSGTVTSVSEFPDAEVAYRALASTGMMYPLTKSGDEAALRASCMEVLDAEASPDFGIRMDAAFGWVVAQRS